MSINVTKLRSTEPRVTISFKFDEPFVGPYGYREEQVAVSDVTVYVGADDGKPYRVDAGGAMIRKDGSIGTRIVHAYSLDWKDLPTEARDLVAREYADIMSSAALTLNDEVEA